MFDRLQSEAELDDVRVADVFAGTGTIGLEALSRGAKSVVFYERDRRAHALLEQNIQALGVEDCTLCWRVDVERTSFIPRGPAAELLPFDVVFFDPPFALTPRIRTGSPLYKSLERLARPEVTAPGALLLIRCTETAEFTCPELWHAQEPLTFSSCVIHLFRKAATPG